MSVPRKGRDNQRVKISLTQGLATHVKQACEADK
jgi:hypothetical protein